MEEKVNFFWFRRDLRLNDNAGLYHALKAGKQVIGLFIFDTAILDKLDDKSDARVTFIHDAVSGLVDAIKTLGGNMIVAHGVPLAIWKDLQMKYNIDTVYTNRDYESYAIKRDADIKETLLTYQVGFETFKDHVIFEGGEILKKDDTPYTVFTPYSKRWKAKLEDALTSFYLKPYPTEKYAGSWQGALRIEGEIPTLVDLGFKRTELNLPPREVARKVIKNYDRNRDFPGIDGTSRLGVHYRFGTISIRDKARLSSQLNATYLNELIWRDFYSMILQHFPYVATGAFREKYERIEWINDEVHFKAWCEGQTGYPLVDAGMRELNQTGHMHNRVRMVVSSFLTKHLLTDWRWGEAYFAARLLDFDLASNNGGWQWAAGCGTDAAPYFRIFNPERQLARFDKDLTYVKKYVPEYGTDTYVKPIVEHKAARERCLATYKKSLNP